MFHFASGSRFHETQVELADGRQAFRESMKDAVAGNDFVAVLHAGPRLGFIAQLIH